MGAVTHPQPANLYCAKTHKPQIIFKREEGRRADVPNSPSHVNGGKSSTPGFAEQWQRSDRPGRNTQDVDGLNLGVADHAVHLGGHFFLLSL